MIRRLRQIIAQRALARMVAAARARQSPHSKAARKGWQARKARG